MHLVAILDVTFIDVDQVLNVQTTIFLQPHCVTEDQWDDATTFPCLDGISAKLQKRKKM